MRLFRYWLLFVVLINASAHANKPTESTPPTAAKTTSALLTAQEMLKSTVLLSVVTVIAETLKQPVAQCFKAAISTLFFVGKMGERGYNHLLCRRPDPLRIDDVQAWESIVENITTTLCEQSNSGTIMLRNIRVDDPDNKKNNNEHWAYYVQFIDQMFLHITHQLEHTLPHYEGAEQQRMFFVYCARSVSTHNREGIAFLMHMIKANLAHIAAVCSKAPSLEELDSEHVKKLSKNTLLLFKKLGGMLQGGSRDATATPSSAASAGSGVFGY